VEAMINIFFNENLIDPNFNYFALERNKLFKNEETYIRRFKKLYESIVYKI